MGLNHAFYKASVFHQRLSPKRHQFTYSDFYFFLDLDHTDTLDSVLSPFCGVYRYRDSDFLPGSEPGDLKARVGAFLQTCGVNTPVDKVYLLTHLRTLGYLFNPVSFYFCLDAEGNPLGAIAEVTNTFYERKAFYVPVVFAENDQSTFSCRVPKQFYVSPFSPLDLYFDFKLSLPEETLHLVVNSVMETGEPIVVTSLTGNRKPWSSGQLFWLTLQCPWVTLKIILLIHWQAFQLWLARVPFWKK